MRPERRVGELTSNATMSTDIPVAMHHLASGQSYVNVLPPSSLNGSSNGTFGDTKLGWLSKQFSSLCTPLVVGLPNSVVRLRGI